MYLELLEEEDGGGVGLEAVGEAEPAVEEPNSAVVAPHSDAAAAARAAGDAARDLGRHSSGRPSATTPAPASAAGGRLLLEELELAPPVHVRPARGGQIGRRRGEAAQVQGWAFSIWEIGI